FAGDFKTDIEKLEKKVEAGADFIQTQAVYDVNGFEEWMDMVRERDIHNRCHILCGIIPIRSLKIAAFLNEKVVGIKIPEEISERFQNAENPEEEGVRITLELIERLRRLEGIKGIHIMPVGWEDVVPGIVKSAGLHPRPKF
ncbi:MAG: methylenetetrahydrofolate reductase, partial [Thermoplasmata archaeon]|nr:methylenetetrahydrofolate reductase [Thermoplasmata archaeon]